RTAFRPYRLPTYNANLSKSRFHYAMGPEHILGRSATRKNQLCDPAISFTLLPILRAEERTMQYRRISADCHLDLPWLPPELFVSEAPREFKDRMPYVEDGPDGPRWTTKAGIFMGIPGAVGSVGAPFVPGQNYRVDKMAETGLYEAGKRGERRPGDPHLRIKEMEKDGVDAEIIFGILGVASRLEDHEAANEM